MSPMDMIRAYLLSIAIMGVMYYVCDSEYTLYLLKPKFGEPCPVDYWSSGETGLCITDEPTRSEKKYISCLDLMTKSYFRGMFGDAKTIPVVVRVPVMAKFDRATFSRTIFTGRARKVYFPNIDSVYEHIITNRPFDYPGYQVCNKLMYCSDITWVCISDSGFDNTCVME